MSFDRDLFLPVSRDDMARRGWDHYDVLIITGDAYVDHPSFGPTIIGRLLEDEGYRVAILAQPDWRGPAAFSALGRPRLAVMISAGNLDSMVAHYTAAKKRRHDDAYSPGRRAGLRPDHATVVYANRAREVFGDIPIIIGGLEASLRRFAHYDYWEDKVRRSILFDAQADILTYGMGERASVEILSRLASGTPVEEITDVRGTCVAARHPGVCAYPKVEVPSFEEVATDKAAYARANMTEYLEHDAVVGKAILQKHGDRFLIVNPPAATFRRPSCQKQLKHGMCKNRACLAPEPCPNLDADHTDYMMLLRKLRAIPGVKKVFIRSGIRFDFLMKDPSGEFFTDLVQHHISGQLKVAPEHCVAHTLDYMGKPHIEVYEKFREKYFKLNRRYGKDQYLVPYLISSHPGCTLEDAVQLAEWLNKQGHMPEQVQDFYPTPGTLATCMWYTGLDPRTMQPVFVPKTPHDKALQRALMQWRKPQNRKLVLEALHKTGREDLIGYGKRCLIRPDKGQAPSVSRREENSAPRGQKAAPGRGKKGPGNPRKERYSGRRSVEKQEQTGRPVRKAGWAKPAASKKGTKGTKGRKKS